MYTPGATGYPAAPDPHGIHLSLLTANGDSLTAAQTATSISGGYTNGGSAGLVFQLTGGGAGQITTLGVVALSIDYSIDWNVNNPNNNSACIRGTVQLPDDSDRQKTIIGNLALSPAGTLYAVEANPTDARADGIFFALREQGQGGFTVVTRFDLYDQFTLSRPGATTVTNRTVTTAARGQRPDPTHSRRKPLHFRQLSWPGI